MSTRPQRACKNKAIVEKEEDDVEVEEEEEEVKKTKKSPAKKKPKKAPAAAAEDDEEEEEEEPKKKSKAKPKKEKKRKSKADDEEDGDDGDEKLPHVKPPGAGSVPRAQDNDEFWKDGDEANIDDPQENDFAWPVKATDGTQLKIVSWNVAGLRACLNKGFTEYVNKESPDIICLQETKVSEKEIPHDDLPKGYTAIFFPCTDRPGLHGTAVLTKIAPLRTIKGLGVPELDKEGRLILVEYDTFVVVNTYVPNSSRGLVHWPLREKWDIAFLAFLRTWDQKKPIIWCGDLNVAHLWIDLANPKSNCNKTAGFLFGERDNFTKILTEVKMDDVYRLAHPKRRKFFTFWSHMGGARAKNVGWRLDYFILSQRITSLVPTIWRRPHVMGSDHAPLCILFNKPATVLPPPAPAASSTTTEAVLPPVKSAEVPTTSLVAAAAAAASTTTN